MSIILSAFFLFFQTMILGVPSVPVISVPEGAVLGAQTGQIEVLGHLPKNKYRYGDLSEMLGGDITVTDAIIYPKDIQEPLALEVSAAYAFDVRSDYEFYAQNADTVLPLASLTKLITAHTIDQLQPNWNAAATITLKDERAGGRLRVANNTQMQLRDLWYASLVGSANNATAALVRELEYEEDDFVKKMNEWVFDQGLMYTNFDEVTGLSSENVSTAREFAHAAVHTLYQSDIFDALRTKTYTVSGHTVRTTNKLLLEKEPKVIVGKTGFTYEAGYNFVALATVNGHEIVTVVLGAKDEDARFSETVRLLEWVDTNFIWE